MTTVLCVGENGAEVGFTEPLQPNMRARIDAGKLRVTAELDDPGVPPTAGEVSGTDVGTALPALVPDTPVVDEVPVPRADTLTVPRGNASKDEWMAYAISQGMDRDEAVSLKRDEIKARLVLDDDEGSREG